MGVEAAKNAMCRLHAAGGSSVPRSDVVRASAVGAASTVRSEASRGGGVSRHTFVDQQCKEHHDGQICTPLVPPRDTRARACPGERGRAECESVRQAVEAQPEREGERARCRRRIMHSRYPARAPSLPGRRDSVVGVEGLCVELGVAGLAACEHDVLLLGAVPTRGVGVDVPADEVLNGGHGGETDEERGGEVTFGRAGPERLNALGDDYSQRGAEQQPSTENRERRDVCACVVCMSAPTANEDGDDGREKVKYSGAIPIPKDVRPSTAVINRTLVLPIALHGAEG
jgi:hypothetical protein